MKSGAWRGRGRPSNSATAPRVPREGATGRTDDAAQMRARASEISVQCYEPA